MKCYGKSSVSEFTGDFIVYRNLNPADPRLPNFESYHREIGLQSGKIPRKTEISYAKAVVYLLKAAMELRTPPRVSPREIKHLLLIGDTRLNDGTAFENISKVGGWPGFAFIGAETSDSPSVEITKPAPTQTFFSANRWSALADFKQHLSESDFPVDETTAVVIDMDKTMLGARGRNAHVIDNVRVQAVRETVSALLADCFDEVSFQVAYDLLNQPQYHPFTTDNQDYLAYICLILESRLFQLEGLVADLAEGRTTTFEDFITAVEGQSDELSDSLKEIHDMIYANFAAGDPTPFKQFRRQEYLTTISKMGCLEDDASIARLVDNEILITQEVREFALMCKERGALLFAISDKPDEASIPTPAQKNEGFLPIHKVKTHILGI